VPPVRLTVDSVAEPHHCDAALAPGENFDAAPSPTLYQANFLKTNTS
jgi:hypothetical protein